MAHEIQSICITDALTVQKPSRHIEYTVQVSTPTRTWSVNRRYNDFCALDAELRNSTGKEPPAKLPPKHWFARTMNDEEKIRQRRVALEVYLRTILTTKDARWRREFGFGDFLAVPASKGGAPRGATGGGVQWTAATWTSEHTAVSGVLRSARAALLKRDALGRVGDAGARASGGEARRLLREAGPRIDALDDALPQLSLGDGEKRRREDLVAALRSEVANLLRMAEAGFRPQTHTPPPEAGDAAPSASGGTMPGAFGAPKARVFGKRAEPQETTETRALDDRGLVQLQHTKMDEQDQQLGVLSTLLQRQRRMGEDIATEVEVQNELLDQLDGDVDKFGSKMARAKRQLNRMG